MNGILLIKKPAGISSFAVVSVARKKLGIRKIGHAGTLDPFAEGLLVLAIGSATRALSDFLLSEKCYGATILLGATSETLDPESEMIFAHEFPKISREKAESLLKHYFLGKIMQVPPHFSALKIDGQRAYALARRGEKREMPARETEVFSAEITDIFGAHRFRDLPAVRVTIRVKSGFYVRSFARDFAEKCGTLGMCSELLRISVGNFSLENAISLEEISPTKIIPITPEMFLLSPVFLGEGQHSDFFHGKKIFFSSEEKGRVAVFSETGLWLGFAEKIGDFLLPKKVIAEQADF